MNQGKFREVLDWGTIKLYFGDKICSVSQQKGRIDRTSTRKDGHGTICNKVKESFKRDK